MRTLWMFCLTVVVAPALTGHVRAEPAATENRFEAAIRRFEAADRQDPPSEGAVLFVGSSSIRLWNLAKSFPELDALNRGFGGSQISDSIHFAQRIVVNYKPRIIVFYAGDNDIAAGKSPAEVFADFEAFATIVHDALPETRLLYIAVKPSLARWQLADRMREANRLIEARTAEQQHLTYVDIFEPMLDRDGKPRRELFVADGLHLNAAGYELWAAILGPHLTSTADR